MGRSLQLVVFALALACLAAAGARAASLQDILYGSTKTSDKASGAAAKQDYNDYEIETMEICLQETNQRSCGESVQCVPCPKCVACIGDSYFWTSGFQCCREEDYDYGYKRPHNSQLFLPVGGGNAIGSCDWTMWWTGAQLEVTSKVWKAGSASATCYYGPDAEECGGPLCDRLAMTLEGTVYWTTQAYSYWGASSTTQNGCSPKYPPWVYRRAANGSADAKPPIAGNNVDSAAGAKPPQAELAYDHGMPDANHPVYSGEATIIMGVITSMTGQRKEKWDEGTFEYTAFLYVTPTSGGIDASALWVRDKAYKLTFYKSPSKY